MVKIQKDGQIKEINKQELPIYISLGWVEVKDFTASYNPNNFKVNK